MALRFIGKDPDSPETSSPTVWVDEDTGDLVFQGWRIIDAPTLADIGTIPAHETVLRMPPRMIPILRQAIG